MNRIFHDTDEPAMRFWTEALIVATAAIGAWLLSADVDPALPRLLATGEHLPVLFMK